MHVFLTASRSRGDGSTQVLERRGLTTLGSVAGRCLVYPFLEAKWCRVVRRTIALPNLPPPFRGTTVALLADVHHGPFVPLAYIRHVVAMTNALKPDIVALVGDYVHRHDNYIAPGIEELGKLKAALGRFAVRGNHDNRNYHGIENFRLLSQAALAEAKLPDLNNTGVWIERSGARLRICGVGDLWTDHQDLDVRTGRCHRQRCRAPLVTQSRLRRDHPRPPRRPGLERAYSRRTDRLARLWSPHRPVSLRAEISLWIGSGSMLPGLRHPRRRYHHSARPIPLPAGGRLDHLGLA